MASLEMASTLECNATKGMALVPWLARNIGLAVGQVFCGVGYLDTPTPGSIHLELQQEITLQKVSYSSVHHFRGCT